jgi:chromosome partitioning protein
MKVLSILNQKGGSGKTTLATQLAHSFSLAGRKVVLGDCDPQGSARDWADAGGSDLIQVLGMDRVSSLKDLHTISCDILVLDGAPKIAEMSAAAIRVSDLVVLPVQPSPYDLWAVDPVVDMIRERRELSGGQPKAAFVISRVIPRTIIAKEILDVLSSGYSDINLCQAVTNQRVAYSNSAAEGCTVFKGKHADMAAQEEITAIRKEIEKWL